MGRYTQKYVSIITVLLVMLMPMSTAFAAVHSIFSNASETQSSVELASGYLNSHDSLELIVDGVVTQVSESIVHDLLLADGSHANLGSGGLNLSIYMQATSDSAVWNYVYLDNGERYELKSVLIPAEIRPPIFF